MYVITVEFTVCEGEEGGFLERVKRQARESLEREPGCKQFDVCSDPKDARRVFLYEIYDDEAAFQLHLESAHFKDFDKTTAGWFERKDVQAWHLAS